MMIRSVTHKRWLKRLAICLLLSLVGLLTACGGLPAAPPTSTPDQAYMVVTATTKPLTTIPQPPTESPVSQATNPVSAPAAFSPYQDATHIITAQLPGTDWQDTGSETYGPFAVEQMQSSDGVLFFDVGIVPDSSALEQNVQQYMDYMVYPAGTPIENVQIHGVSALRIETVACSTPECYHTIEYAFRAAGNQYMVSVSGTNAQWADRGRDEVQGILDSIQIK